MKKYSITFLAISLFVLVSCNRQYTHTCGCYVSDSSAGTGKVEEITVTASSKDKTSGQKACESESIKRSVLPYNWECSVK